MSRPVILVALVALMPGCMPEPAQPAAPALPAIPEGAGLDYDAHIAALRARLPSGEFHIVVAEPFVVIGDEAAARVAQRARATVTWAVDSLKRRYFERDPDHVIDVWLFRDAASYRRHCLELFGESPSTPFGYYSPRHKALVMDISTGGGTLVHEIVHPFVAANFPACPAWFNEGLGSLYEQSGERDGRIVGFTNWRLRGLQDALRAGEVATFATLTATTSDAFYGDDRGTNYSQARYLCYYLQEKGLLQRFYRAFVAGHREDPTGYETLQDVLGRPDMAAFQQEWRRFTLGLHFDG